MKLLIIDDDSDLLEMTSKRFTRKGFQTETCLNLSKAKEILNINSDIKCIICDLFLLDGENGIDFFESETIKKFNGKFVLATGDDTADSRIEKYKQSYKNFNCFQKPYSIEDVIKFIE